MLLSVIIITLNEERNLKRLLEQLRQQSFKDVEIIVADAHSKDRTRDVARSFDVQVVDGGLPSVGRNAGAAVATGDLLLFLDADTVFPSTDFLKDMLAEMQHRRLDIAGVTLFADTSNPVDRFGYWCYSKYALLWGSILPHAVGTCIFSKTFVHRAIDGFDETVTLAEDMLYARQGSNVGRFGILKTHSVGTPPRRIQKEGRIRLAFKLIWAEIYMLVNGPIRNNAITWDFDHSD